MKQALERFHLLSLFLDFRVRLKLFNCVSTSIIFQYSRRMGSSASCRNSQVQSTIQKETVDKHKSTRSFRSDGKVSVRLDHAKSVIKKRPAPSDEPNLTEELNCSWCEVPKEKSKDKKHLVSKNSKTCLFPYQKESRAETTSDLLPRTPSHYETVNNWKTLLPGEKSNELNEPSGSNEIEKGNVKNSSEVQINSSTDSIRTFVLVQDEQQKQVSDFIPPLIAVQLDPGESQSSSDSNSNDECENDDNSSTKDSPTSQTESEGHESITENLRTNISSEFLHETQGVRGCDNDNVIGEILPDPNDEHTSPGDGELNHEMDLAQDGIVNILDSLQECNLDDMVTISDGRSEQCLCGHVCSDDRYRDTLMEMIREETPDRKDLVTSIFCDEYYHEDKMGKKLRSFDDDDASLEVNIRSPSLAGHVCRLCLTEDILEEDEEDESPQQYRVIEELQLNKYELFEYEDEEKDVKSDCPSDEEDNFNSDHSTSVIIEENPFSALSESTDQEIDFLGRNVSFDRDELSTILLRDKRQKFADLRTRESSENNGSRDRKNKVKNRKSRAKYSKETCQKKRKMRRRSVCGKLECSFCDLVNLTGREEDGGSEWNQLDSDTVKLMDILEKLSRVLAEKAKGLVNRRNQNQRQQNEDDDDDDCTYQIGKKDQLHELRQLGVSVKKVENRRRLLILKDDASQYKIQGLYCSTCSVIKY